MDWELILKILNAVALLLGGGAFVAVLRYLVDVKKIRAEQHGTDRDADRVDFTLILSEVRSQRDDAKALATKQEGRINQMEAEIHGLRLARDLDPFPNWVVDKDGEYLYVNREFERHFLEPLNQTYRDIIGKSHKDIWPPDFCRTLRSLDAAARSRPDGTARATTVVAIPTLGAASVTVHKFPVRFKPSGVVVAYAGYITDLEPEQQLIGHQS
jgi:PAS domain-containing protein